MFIIVGVLPLTRDEIQILPYKLTYMVRFASRS